MWTLCCSRSLRARTSQLPTVSTTNVTGIFNCNMAETLQRHGICDRGILTQSPAFGHVFSDRYRLKQHLKDWTRLVVKNCSNLVQPVKYRCGK
jgi:hypothetical protein